MAQAMKIALGIYRLQPRGGLEDHCVRIGEALARRGHAVTVLSMAPGDVRSELFDTVGLARAGLAPSNHGRMRQFAAQFAAATRGGYERTVSFQPVRGVDVLFCADPVRGAAPLFRRLLPRQRAYSAMEADCFGPTATTRIMLLSAAQAQGYVEFYGTPEHRVRILPPSLDPEKRRPDLRTAGHRKQARQRLALGPDAAVLLWAGLQPNVKGLDRVVEALALVPGTTLLIAGLAPGDPKATPVKTLIAARGLSERVRWLGFLREDALAEAMAAADVLAHPARSDVTGGVIVEAIINGLPAVGTDCCGFAHHVADSGAGMVVSARFDPGQFVEALQRCLGPGGASMSQRGIAYGATADLFSGIDRAAELIEAPSWAGL